jgi:hypothetical protein
MTRSKRHSLRGIALGLAVAALISPAAAQARPLDVDGLDARSIHQLSLPVRDAEELAFTRHPAKPATANHSKEDKSFEAGVGSLVGLVLILAAAGAAVAVHHGKKTKLSPA